MEVIYTSKEISLQMNRLIHFLYYNSQFASLTENAHWEKIMNFGA